MRKQEGKQPESAGSLNFLNGNCAIKVREAGVSLNSLNRWTRLGMKEHIGKVKGEIGPYTELRSDRY